MKTRLSDFIKEWTLWKHFGLALVLAALTSIFIKLWDLFISKPVATSMAIIGGADGPTHIYLVGNLYVGFIPLVAFGLMMMAYPFLKKKKGNP